MAVNDSIDRINIGGDERMIKPGAENVRVNDVLIGGESWTPGNVQTALENLRNYVKDNATQIAGLSGKTDLVFGSLNNGIFYDINGNEAVRSATLLYIDRSTGIIYRWGANSFEQVGGKEVLIVSFTQNGPGYLASVPHVTVKTAVSMGRLVLGVFVGGKYDGICVPYVGPEVDPNFDTEWLGVFYGCVCNGSLINIRQRGVYLMMTMPNIMTMKSKLDDAVEQTSDDSRSSTGLTARDTTFSGGAKIDESAVSIKGDGTIVRSATQQSDVTISLPSSSGTLALQSEVAGKQDALVSGQNIKTVNGQSVLGAGNLELGELFVVTMTQHNSVYTADKSVDEIYAASYTNGKPVIAVMRDINNPVLILTDCDPDADSYVFSAIESNSVTTLRWQRSDDYTYELETIVLQPHLVSGTNIKTLNNETLLGSGNVTISGKSAYQSYVDTTTDSPVKTEAEWVASLKGEDGVSLGEVAIADNQTTDDATKVLSARQGYLLGQKVNDVDDVPTAGSEKFVKSGGVQNELSLGAVYDVSAKNPTAGINNDGKWESLSTLLFDANLNTLIPTSVRKGGMSIKFVQSSDNKYVQYYLTKNTWSGRYVDWQKTNLEYELNQLGQGINKQRTLQLYDNTTELYNINSTSAKLLIDDGAAVAFVSKVDARLGDSFSFKFIGLADTVVALTIFATDSLTVGDYCQQLGSATPSYMRGAITLAQNSTYIVVVAKNASAIDENTANLLKDTLVLVKSNDYPSTYTPYKKLAISAKDAGAIAVEQGVENAHKTIVVNNDGNAIPKVLSYSELQGAIPFRRTEQLFDKENVVLYNMNATTVSRTFYNSATSFLFVINCNVSVGDSLYFNLQPLPSNMGISGFGAGIGNNLPVENEQYLQAFNTNTYCKRGYINSQYSASYVYIWFISDSAHYNYDLLKVLDSLVLVKGTDYATEYIPYKVIDIEDEVTLEELGGVAKQQGSANYGKFLIVGADGLVTLREGGGEDPTANSVLLHQSKTLYLSADVINNPNIVLGAGWSGDLTNGLSHTAGSTSIVEIQQSTENNKKYLVQFNLSSAGEAGLFMQLGNTPWVDTYNGGTSVAIGVISDGGTLKFRAASGQNITITNIHIKEVVGSESAVETLNINIGNVEDGTMFDNITGFWNIAIGYENTLQKNQNGSRNIALGYAALSQFESGTRNISVGTFAGSKLKSGDHNISIGADSFYFVTEGSDNISIGYTAMGKMQEMTANHNIAIGTTALGNIQAGAIANIGIGYGACYHSSSRNIGLGYQACYGTRGSYNTAVGHQAQHNPYATGDNNVSIGALACCGIGGSAGSFVEVNNSIAIGYNAQATKSNQVVIGNSNHIEFVLGTKKLVFNNDNSVTWETIS